MICHSSKELLSYLRYCMDMNDIQQKDISIALDKPSQSISQVFTNGNPKCSTFFEMIEAAGLQADIIISKRN